MSPVTSRTAALPVPRAPWHPLEQGPAAAPQMGKVGFLQLEIPKPALNSSPSATGCVAAQDSKGLPLPVLPREGEPGALGPEQRRAPQRMLMRECSWGDAHWEMLVAGCSWQSVDSWLCSRLCQSLFHYLNLQKAPVSQALGTKRLHPSPAFRS